MDPYSTFFYVGCVGLTVMAFLGVAGGHGHHGGGHNHDAGGFHLHGTGGHGHAHTDVSFHHAPTVQGGVAHGHSTGVPVQGGNGHHGHHLPNVGKVLPKGQGRTSSGGRFNLRTAVMGWLSPRVLLTLSMGGGATGLLLANTLPGEPLRALAALAGGVALEKIVVAPMWNFLTRFASTPARTLDSAVLEEATAITGFDTSGCGLVSINLDGHEMRLLARLAPEHRQDRIRSGDILIVDSVDSARGQCVVSPSQSLNLQ